MIYYVDGDNSPGRRHHGIDKLSEKDTVKIFFAISNLYYRKGNKQNDISNQTKAKVIFRSVPQNPDSADFAVCMELMADCAKGEKKFVLISGDKHFETIRSNIHRYHPDIIIKNAETIADGKEKTELLDVENATELRDILRKRFGRKFGDNVYHNIKKIIIEENKPKEKETMKAYKLIRKLKDGKDYPLFIGKTKEYEFGKWLNAEYIPTKGFAPRKGFHCCFKPYAPHLKEQLSNGEQRVWVECEVEDWELYNRPESQGGSWILAQRIKILREITFDEVNDILKNNN